ncbi:hypothetical protein AVEN_200738-1 [Araneus ventricosus]|uniref:Uncharacterized protein n=1 Tax=Araneus ventricosus TaxID=182803 RepID=A0A4Y2X313_ARAVE|nr:hypothetical protein AVEN_200738-1 [Araneus ventricosus]
MTRKTPQPAPALQTSVPHQQEDVWPPAHDLMCNRPNTRQIFSEIRIRTWSPPAPKPKPYHKVTAASRTGRCSSFSIAMYRHSNIAIFRYIDVSHLLLPNFPFLQF